MASAMTLPAGWMISKHGLMNWSKEAGAIQRRLANLPDAELAELLGRAATAQLDEMTRGIQAYRKHPYRRTLADPPVIWKEGSSRLLDYGLPSSSEAVGQTALFVPSLINRAYILDLDEKRSLMRWLAKKGVRPLLLDWGTPGRLEKSFDLAAYTARLGRALRELGPVHLVGYCMGGLIALSAAAKFEVKSLTLMATPWDFHAPSKEIAQRSSNLYKIWQPVAEKLGYLPVDAIQALFTLADPMGPQRKFRKFAHEQDDGFVAMEDWINDGIPLSKPVADDCLLGLYGNNRPKRFINPHDVEAETLLMVPKTDRIVPPESALALAEELSDAHVQEVPLGHVGMIVSHSAPELVWQPLAKWLGSR